MRAPLLLCLLPSLLLAPLATVRAASVHEAATAYLRDPAGGAAAFLEIARADRGDLNPLHALLLGDAAIRVGQPDVARELLLAVRANTGNPALVGLAEMMLAWTALDRGRLPEAVAHLEAAGAANPDVRPITDVAAGAIAAARRAPDAPARLADAFARPVDPAWRDLALLIDGYARLWAGDAEGAAAVFSAFAVANPGSRFADDAQYAAAHAKRRAGFEADAEADLAALAGAASAARGVPRGLIALEPRALLREGVRRDRTLPARSLPNRFADLFDGDGVELARAALAAQRRQRARAGATTTPGHDAPETRGADRAYAAGANRTGAAAPRTAAPRGPAQADAHPPATAPGDPDTAGSAARTAGSWIVLAALLTLLAFVLRKRARRPA